MKSKYSAVFLALLLLFTAFPFVAPVFADGEAWLDGFNNRISFYIDTSYVDSTLTNFTVCLNLSSSSGISDDDLTAIFDEVGNSYLKTAITLADGETQCYTEVNKWNATTEKALLFFNAPSVSSSSNTVFYFYYDSTADDNTVYVGLRGSAASDEVWPDDSLVYHMDDGTTATVVDSSPNDYTATKLSANNPTETGSFLGSEQDFSTDYLDLGSYSTETLTDESTMTFQTVINIDSFLSADDGKNTIFFNYGYYWQVRGDAGNVGKIAIYLRGTSNPGYHYSTSTLTTSTNYHLAFTYDGTFARIYINGTLDKTISATGSPTCNAFRVSIGAERGGSDFRYLDGSMDEFYAQEGAKSAEYIETNYYNLFDGLIEWGSFEALTTAKYVTFILANSTYGDLYVNGTLKTNGTTTEYSNGTILNLIAAVNNASYIYLNFTAANVSATENNYNYTVTANDTITTYFSICSGGSGPGPDYTPLVYVALAVAVLGFSWFVADSKKWI